ncbi:MAG: sodium:proton antiporter [Desulfobacteraceae bacterium]|nr:sodium:proton antiporter [Desulfobacteraceae bacterium]MBC2755724.1 sodium:proton antiporter [Desulfobacteraceae bacterium]
MDGLNVTSGLVTLAGVFAYINYRFFRLPTTVGLMLISLVISIVILFLGKMGIHFDVLAVDMVQTIDFDETLMHGMLSFLLFAGALHININNLGQQKYVITFLATFGVLISTVIIGCTSYWVLYMIGADIPFIYCLVFGSLISPTDPISVMSILKTAGAPKSLETKIAGESLFNDGVGVVVFLILSGIAAGGQEIGILDALGLFFQEAIGGAVFGFWAGYITFLMLRGVDNYQVEVLLTLGLVMGGYSLASALHLSAPIAIVVAGLLIGNHGRMLGMSEKTRDHLDNFWELLDEILNAVLFVLIGLEILIIPFHTYPLWVAFGMIPIVLSARFVSVSIPVMILRFRREFSPNVIKILTWGGLRGGISVALALSLTAEAPRDAILTFTYVVVVFSILVQGLTVGHLIKAESSS